MTTGERHAPIGGGLAAVATLGWIERPQPVLFAKLSGSSRWATGDQKGPCTTTGDQPTRVSAVDVPDCSSVYLRFCIWSVLPFNDREGASSAHRGLSVLVSMSSLVGYLTRAQSVRLLRTINAADFLRDR